MRNPLNSIINQCSIMQSLQYQCDEILEVLRNSIDISLYSEMKEIFREYIQSVQTQRTSSSLLLMNVEDILGFAQIKAGKFTKNTKLFSVKKAIMDIMSI